MKLDTYIKLYSRNELPLLLNYLNLKGIGVEVGVGGGFFSNLILERSELSVLYSVDSWEELSTKEYDDISNVTQEEQLKNKLRTANLLGVHGKRSIILPEFSNIVASKFEDNKLDFVYLDANHKYENVKEDLELWYPKVKVGGVFAGHDYFDDGIYRDGVFGVKSAVDEFIKNENQELFIIKENSNLEGYNSWYFIKEEFK